MSKLILPRRKFLIGAASLFVAPAIVRATSLMPVRVVPPLEPAGTLEVGPSWSHLAVTRRGEELSVFVDGVRVEETADWLPTFTPPINQFGAQALQLDGSSDYIATPDSPDFQFDPKNWVFDCWFNGPVHDPKYINELRVREIVEHADWKNATFEIPKERT